MAWPSTAAAAGEREGAGREGVQAAAAAHAAGRAERQRGGRGEDALQVRERWCVGHPSACRLPFSCLWLHYHKHHLPPIRRGQLQAAFSATLTPLVVSIRRPPLYARQPFPLARVDNVSATLTPAQRMRRHPSVASVTQARRVLRAATTDSYKFLISPSRSHPTFPTFPSPHFPLSALLSYKHASNGFSATLTPAQVQRMRRHPSVASVTQARVVRPATTHSYKFLGLPGSLWADAGGPSSAGDGTVIGIVDTGIWPEHASFDDMVGTRLALPSPSALLPSRSLHLSPLNTGYSSTLPAGWSGTCPTTSDFTCNNKIIGGGVFHAGFESGGTTIDLSADWDSPRDSFGHGTWCAGAAAGNSNVQISNIGAASGMAPGARLAVYKVFWQAGGNLYATSTDIFSAVDQAVADGVDVLSLSLGGASSTDTYFDDVPFISVNAAGVFVAFAAGNEGRPSSAAASGYRTLCNFAPFYMTVGASSISRNGASISSTTAAAATAAPLETPFNTTASTVSTLNGVRIPASISPAATAAPVVAYFSSTGPLAKPSAATPAAYPSNTILKPDIIAPGVELWAAAPDKTVGSGGWFVALSGTSMATPHIAGIAALIIQQRPDWTPLQIMSAMMTTARTTDISDGAIQNEFGRAATPWEIGAGHVVPARVVNPGLTYNAGEQDFQNFLAGQNYNRAKVHTKYAEMCIPGGAVDQQQPVARYRCNTTCDDRLHPFCLLPLLIGNLGE
ncbi:unnamed protein product [Closterium sp. NIES-65]|nr:unnamed protein product [Closterium sp. NIES-65]